ncbi:PREDICTED: uncharacterized protein LOC109474154 [Branchiostoma belcheri]|uniref:Uncharacterized protein LOC109474154 n=1 Tax=Branchiostoma belcheri TaxID=7741 RepID=A0A6P4ZJY7_BRABE|nr:PREDICTED: uncharacterized protein LOC109474154 [Branchiostoma belcheri]
MLAIFSFVFEGRQQRTRGRQDRTLAPILLLFLTSTTLYLISKYFAEDFSATHPVTEETQLATSESTPVSPLLRDYEKVLLRKRRDRPNDQKSNNNYPVTWQLVPPATNKRGVSTHKVKFNKAGSSDVSWKRGEDNFDMIQLDVKGSLHNRSVDVLLSHRVNIPSSDAEAKISKPPDANKPDKISTNDYEKGKLSSLDKGSHDILQKHGEKISDSNHKPVDSNLPPASEESSLRAGEEASSFIDDEAYFVVKRKPGNNKAEFFDISPENTHPTSLEKGIRAVDEEIIFVIEEDDVLRSKKQSTEEDVKSHVVFTGPGTFDTVDKQSDPQSSHTKSPSDMFNQHDHLEQDLMIRQKVIPIANEGKIPSTDQEGNDEELYFTERVGTQQKHLPEKERKTSSHSLASSSRFKPRKTREISDIIYEEGSGDRIATTQVPVQHSTRTNVSDRTSTVENDVVPTARITRQSSASTATASGREAADGVTETVATPGHWIIHSELMPEVREYTGSAHYKTGMWNGVKRILVSLSKQWKPLGTPRNHNDWFVVLDYHVSYTMKKLRIVNYGCDWNHDVKAFTLQVSATGSPYRWTHVLTVTDVATNSSLPQYYGGFSASGRYWRVTVTATYSGWEPWIRTFQLFGIKDCRRDVVPDIMLPLKAEICCVPGHLNWNPEPELRGLQCSTTASCRVCGGMTGNSCGCDKACRTFGDCCHNYEAACGDDVTENEDVPDVIQPDSCKGRCNKENVVSKVTCNCTSSCNMTETCCDDFEDVCRGAKDDGTGDVNITPTEVIQPLQCVAPWNFRSHFWLVASCPPGYEDDVVRGMCETSYGNGDVDMFLHAPVTDNSTDTNYRNVFCALCNNARFMIGWKMVAKCGYKPADPLKTILQDKDDICEHYFRPSVAPARLCFPPHTTSPRPSLRCDPEKCRNTTAVFYVKAEPFRNSACAECYADEDDLFDTSCKADESIFVGFLGTITVLFDYSNILQSKMSSTELEVFDHTESCSVGFIYDPFRDNCRKISFVPPKQVRKDTGVKVAEASFENDPDDLPELTPSPTKSPYEFLGPTDNLATQSLNFPQQSATFLVINTVSGASALVSILYLISGLRHYARAESAVKIWLLACLLLAHISQVVGQVVPSAACCTAMLVCTLCFCLAAGLSLTATIHHLSILQRGGTCKAAGHLLVIVLIPMAMSGGYVALDDSIRMGASQPLYSLPICWIDDPVKMAVAVVVPLLICTLVDLYFLLRIAMRCVTADIVQYRFLAQGALLFLPFTAAMTTGVLTAYNDSEPLRTAFLYMLITLGGVEGFLFLVFSIVEDQRGSANVVNPPLPKPLESLSSQSAL